MAAVLGRIEFSNKLCFILLDSNVGQNVSSHESIYRTLKQCYRLLTTSPSSALWGSAFIDLGLQKGVAAEAKDQRVRPGCASLSFVS